MKHETTGDKLAAEVGALLRARNPIIILVTPEEARVEGVVASVAASLKYGIKFWDCAQGLTDLFGKEAAPGKAAKQPGAALQAVGDSKAREVFVLRDFHPFWKAPVENRALRNLARKLPDSPGSESRSIVIVTPSSDVPPEFSDHVVVVKWKLPDREEMAGVFDRFVADLADEIGEGKARKPHPGKSTPPNVREAAIDAAMGLSVVQAQNVFSKSVVTRRGAVDPQVIADAKKQIINASSGIEYHDPDPRGLDAVGGLDVLKGWLQVRRAAFSQKAREYGLPPPRGCCIVGVPGTGKSLVAKALAATWGVPFIRMDLGAMKGSLVGQSERNVRAALAIIDAIGNCVVLIDEIEKALAGASGSLDSGVSADQFGAVLTWMQERRGGAFIAATANNIRALPPELIRRFDEVWAVDVPTAAERREIFRVTFAGFGRADLKVDYDEIVSATDGYTGAEIAQKVVPGALYAAFDDGGREIKTEDIVESAKHVVPIVRTMKEPIDALRDWVKSGRARAASLPEVAGVSGGSRALDVGDDDVGIPGSN